MKKLLFVIISTIMISGLLLGSMNSSVYAEHTDKPGKSKGCDNASEKAKGIEKNPHCKNVGDDGIPPNTCDTDNDGSITSEELGFPARFITVLEDVVSINGGDTNMNGEIDTLDEWNELQKQQPGKCLP